VARMAFLLVDCLQRLGVDREHQSWQVSTIAWLNVGRAAVSRYGTVVPDDPVPGQGCSLNAQKAVGAVILLGEPASQIVHVHVGAVGEDPGRLAGTHVATRIDAL